MSIFNIDHIINGTPKKRLINAYDKMHENYTESTAQEYFDTYKNEPLSFLLENSRMIFSEPYYGYKFYKENVIDNIFCEFTKLEKEYDKIDEYLEENGLLMNESQKNLYEDLKSSLNTLLEHTKNTRIYANYIKEFVDDRFEYFLSDAVYECVKSENDDTSKIFELFETVNNPMVFFTYIPYVIEATNSSDFNKMANVYCESSSVPQEYNELQWRRFAESTICGNKLSLDTYYKEAVNNINNKNTKLIFEYFMNTSLSDKIDELIEERVNPNDVTYELPTSAVNNIFFDIQESAISDDQEFREDIERYKGIVYESSLNILIAEYQMSESTEDIAEGYSIMNESVSLDKAYETLNQLYSESASVFTEAGEEEDVSDEDIDNLSKDDENKEQKEENKPYDSKPEVSDEKKPQAPKPKNLANKIQFKAMDKDAKRQQKKAIRQQKGQDIINAAKAVTAAPKNLLDSIKMQMRNLDKKDEARRKSYMTEPGFRKKAFRNLKVAILYGTAATAKLALVPAVAICRHFSKNKDRRIRNELIREIQTEMKVCDEKISDANANSDQAEKYRLIRIRDRLDAELVRVKTNSKYI